LVGKETQGPEKDNYGRGGERKRKKGPWEQQQVLD
jgi:hypothetical protein